MTDPFLKAEHAQGSPEWLEHRRRHIGASDAPIIMGDSPWKTIYQLWLEKMGMGEETVMTPAMQRGIDLEPYARAVFEGIMGTEVFPQVVYHDQNPFMMASLDGLSLDGKIAVEIKCPGQKTHEIAVNGEVPRHYYAQLQHQLACTGLPSMYYCSFTGEGKTAIIEVKRDDQYIRNLIAEEELFWRCVEDKTSPPLTARDYKERDDEGWHSCRLRLEWLEMCIKSLEVEKQSIKKRLIEESGGHSCRGGGMSLSRSVQKGRVDYTKIPELKDVDLDKYRDPAQERWTLRITTNNE